MLHGIAGEERRLPLKTNIIQITNEMNDICSYNKPHDQDSRSAASFLLHFITLLAGSIDTKSSVSQDTQPSPDAPDPASTQQKYKTPRVGFQTLYTLLTLPPRECKESIVPAGALTAESLYICSSQVVTSVPSAVICVNQSAAT